MKRVSTHIQHNLNRLGKDFFVGDIHGCYDQLMAQLNAIGFNKESDRLFSVGDLVDRGEQSLECLRLINEPWFYAVIGNHEELLYQSIRIDYDRSDKLLHLCNGGVWADDLTEDEIMECLELLKKLPLSRTINTSDLEIGVIHAGWGWSWGDLKKTAEISSFRREFATWARLDDPYMKKTVPSIDFVISGHQNLEQIEIIGNQLWIDTIGQTKKLTILSSEEIKEITHDQGS